MKRLYRSTFGEVEPGEFFLFPFEAQEGAKVTFIVKHLGVRGDTPWCYGNGSTGPFEPGDNAKVWRFRK